MLIYLKFVMNPPKVVIDQIHKIMAKFFWGNTTGWKEEYWVARNRCAYQKRRRDWFKVITSYYRGLFEKLWWNIRTSTNFLWSGFMWNKYCKKWYPLLAQGTGTSHVWRKMIQMIEEIEYNIWWKIKCGNASFWFDN